MASTQSAAAIVATLFMAMTAAGTSPQPVKPDSVLGDEPGTALLDEGSHRPEGVTEEAGGARLSTGDGLTIAISPAGRIDAVELGAFNLTSTSTLLSGFRVRDLTLGGERSFNGSIEVGPSTAYQNATIPDLGLVLNATYRARADRISIEATVDDLLGREHAMRLKFALPTDVLGWTWWDDIRNRRVIDAAGTYRNAATLDSQGRERNVYPFAAVTNATLGEGLALATPFGNPSLSTTNVTRDHMELSLLVATSNLSQSRAPRLEIELYRFGNASWGFRAAAAEFYDMHPDDFTPVVQAEGTWAVNSPLDAIPSPQDFGFGIHEVQFPQDIANATVADDSMGVRTIGYLHARSYIMGMGNWSARPSHQEIVTELNNRTSSNITHDREWSRATLLSGCRNATGEFAYYVYARPDWFPPNGWGAAFCLNSHPTLAQQNSTWMTAGNHSLVTVDRQFALAQSAGADLDGIFLDGLVDMNIAYGTIGSGDDFRPEHLVLPSPFPLVPSAGSGRTVIPQHLAVYDLGENISATLRDRSRLLMQNDPFPGYWISLHLVDAAGIEVNWLPGGVFKPTDSSYMDLWRTLAHRKYFGTLMRSDFAAFTPMMVERYFERSAFWAIFPSFFANNDKDEDNYFSNSSLYERDRWAFAKYVSIIRDLHRAGWEPVTHAIAGDPRLMVERYGPANGTLRFALLNEFSTGIVDDLTVDLTALGFPTLDLSVTETISNVSVPFTVSGGKLTANVSVLGNDTWILAIAHVPTVPESGDPVLKMTAVIAMAVATAALSFFAGRSPWQGSRRRPSQAGHPSSPPTPPLPSPPSRS